jgi:hypothetical protein
VRETIVASHGRQPRADLYGHAFQYLGKLGGDSHLERQRLKRVYIPAFGSNWCFEAHCARNQ